MRSSTLSITRLNENGYGQGQRGGQTLSVARTAPGDTVRIGEPASKERWASAPLLAVLTEGPDRVTPRCEAFEAGCGGCQWQHLSGAAQQAWKLSALTERLRAGNLYRGPIAPVVGPAPSWGYRNKLSLKAEGGRFTFLTEFDGRALSPADCPVQTPALQAAWAALRGLKVPAGVEQVHLRSNGAGQVGLHAHVRDGVPGLDAALAGLLKACPGGVGLGRTGRSGYRVVAGDAVLAQTVGPLTWPVPHNGFFQTNADLAPALLDAVRTAARLGPGDRLLDLYCGVGFFGLALAPQVAEVVGIEENPASVEAARAAARLNGWDRRVRFEAGDLGPVLAALPVAEREVVVVDPPREGLRPRALEALITRRPRRVVYVSCYPASLARDLRALGQAGWRGQSCVPIDMFPHTSHLEVVVSLERR